MSRSRTHPKCYKGTRELLDWLRLHKINNLFTVPGSGRPSNSGGAQDGEEEMSDADLTSKLKKELVRSTKKSDLDMHPIPAGDSIFMFTLLRGRNNERIQTFIDWCKLHCL